MAAHRSAELLCLGPLEARVMRVLWAARGPANVGDVLLELNRGGGRPLSYSTAKAVLLNLTRKGWVSKRADGRANVFAPQLSHDEYEQRSVAQIVQPLLRSHRNPLLAHIVDEVVADESALAEFERLLAQRKAQHHG